MPSYSESTSWAIQDISVLNFAHIFETKILDHCSQDMAVCLTETSGRIDGTIEIA
jgi:hypothetical protein